MKNTRASFFLCTMVLIGAVGCMCGTSAFAVDALSVDRIFTTDQSGNLKTYFSPGEAIRYKADFTLASPLTVVLLGGFVKGGGFDERLPLQYGVLGPGTYTTVWDSTVPNGASGTATVSISYVGLIDTIITRSFPITVGSPNQEPDNVGSDACALCHSAVADSLGDSSHGFIECETCHGPGGLHVAAPSPDNIIVDSSAELCGECHSRGDDLGRVVVEDGLLKRNQQYDELLAGGKRGFKCVRCHNPHISIAANPSEALVSECFNCHSQGINQIHVAAGVDCIDCHMPYAVKVTTATGDGDYLKGDGRSHIFTIDETRKPFEMFYLEADATYSYGFLTLNFACLGCHDGGFAPERSFEWAEQTARLIHAE